MSLSRCIKFSPIPIRIKYLVLAFKILYLSTESSHLISTACPTTPSPSLKSDGTCYDLPTPPIALLCFAHRMPDVIVIGAPTISLMRCNDFTIYMLMLSAPHPHWQANSLRLKFFDKSPTDFTSHLYEYISRLVLLG